MTTPQGPGGSSNYLLAIKEVAQYRVNESQPATSNANGLDYVRCSALHNAIVRHAWLASGYDIETIPVTTLWATPHNIPYHEMEEQRLHSSLAEFFKRAIMPEHQFPDEPQDWNFFYFLPWVRSLPDMFTWDQVGLSHLLTVYDTRPEFKGKMLDGIVYDQNTHFCLFLEAEFDLSRWLADGQALPWQPLETILSVYLDMIERRKIVALSKNVAEPPVQYVIPQPDGTFKQAEMPSRPGWIPLDPATGLRRIGEVFNPWKVQPFAQIDVDDTLMAWNMLVEHIERRMELAVTSTRERGLYTEDVLRQIGLTEDRFAWQFLTQARRPHCAYLGPGLRLQTVEEFLKQPFRDLEDEDFPLHPIQILRGEQQAKDVFHGWDNISSIPSGLYLDACNPDGLWPFEDGCRLALPYRLGHNGYIKTSDGWPMQGSCELYQLGQVNPFMPRHSTPLLGVLCHFRGYVETGMWEVGPDGVKEQIDRFKEADTDMARCRDSDERIYPGYVCELGAGGRWW